ncbi:hypothetical protein FRC17_004722 [Serendipita sp. 399]|nr:hypothetical protein FRC17_004722 [Serendipita sp. 399]
MIDQEKPMDKKVVETTNVNDDEPPPYSRRQASTSSNRLRSPVQRSTTNSGGRFIAPVPETRHSIPEGRPAASPRLVVSHADTDHANYSQVGYNPNIQPASFTDLALEKHDDKVMYGHHDPYSASTSRLSPVQIPGSYGSPGPSSRTSYQGEEPQNDGLIGIGPRSPTTSSRKNSEAVILMGTGSSGMWLNHLVVATKGEPIQGAYHIDPNLPVPDHATPRRKKTHARSSSSSSKSGKKKGDPSWHPTTAPESAFSGPLHVHTDGEITLLPRLAATMEVISAREDDALVMITSNSKPLPSPPPSASSSRQNTGALAMASGFGAWLHPQLTGSRTQLYEGDFANLTSSSGGNIIVGFLGEDKIQEPSPGLWKKFVGLFQRSNTA